MRVSLGFKQINGHLIAIYDGNFPTIHDVRKNSKYDFNIYDFYYGYTYNLEDHLKSFGKLLGYIDLISYFDFKYGNYNAYEFHKGSLNIDIIKYHHYNTISNSIDNYCLINPIENGTATYAVIFSYHSELTNGFLNRWEGGIENFIRYKSFFYSKLKVLDYTQQETDKETITYLSTLNFNTSQTVKLFYTKLYYNLDFDIVKISGDLVVNFNNYTTDNTTTNPEIPSTTEPNIPPIERY